MTLVPASAAEIWCAGFGLETEDLYPSGAMIGSWRNSFPCKGGGPPLLRKADARLRLRGFKERAERSGVAAALAQAQLSEAG